MINMEPIGIVRSTRKTPIDDNWSQEASSIFLDESQFGPDALLGLEAFSHVEILYWFNQAKPEKVNIGARHPRGIESWPKVGIFAQRGKDRPNHIGATICAIKEISGTQLLLEGLDAIDGTPVLDIKPVMEGFLPRSRIKEPNWAKEIMAEYWDANNKG